MLPNLPDDFPNIHIPSTPELNLNSEAINKALNDIAIERERKERRNNFRANLALLISALALLVAILTFFCK